MVEPLLITTVPGVIVIIVPVGTMVPLVTITVPLLGNIIPLAGTTIGFPTIIPPAVTMVPIPVVPLATTTGMSVTTGLAEVLPGAGAGAGATGGMVFGTTVRGIVFGITLPVLGVMIVVPVVGVNGVTVPGVNEPTGIVVTVPVSVRSRNRPRNPKRRVVVGAVVIPVTVGLIPTTTGLGVTVPVTTVPVTTGAEVGVCAVANDANSNPAVEINTYFFTMLPPETP